MSRTYWFNLRRSGLFALLGLTAAMADPVKAPAAGPKAAAAASAQADSTAVAFTDQDILRHVNLAISWYQQVRAGSQMLSQPSDVFFWNAQCTLAGKAIPAVFASARAMLPLAAPPPVAPKAPVAAGVEKQRLAQLAAARVSSVEHLQSQITALDVTIRTAADRQTQASLALRKSALQSEVGFLIERRNALQKLGGLLSAPAADSGATLAGQIDSLEQSIADELTAALPPAAPDPAAANGMGSGGVIARTGALYRQVKCLRGLDQLLAVTDQLQKQTAEGEAPLIAAIKSIVQQGDLAGEKVEKGDSSQEEDARRLVDSLSGKFEAVCNALLARRQEESWFHQSLHNLQQWRDSVRAREIDLARSLAIRTATIVIMLALVLAISAAGRHLILRYVSDERRRGQFLFIRRMVTGVLLVIVIGTGFVSDFGSLATFAGLLTAGIAVALQTIIASVAAYFFLLGRYGLKVGDRITAGGVTGEVAEVGLVRFYLRELVATGPDFHPTGRVVVFPNSVIFQANPLFKQLSGTEYTWHEATVTLSAGANAAFVREKILTAVTAAYEEYRPLLEGPRAKAEKVSGMKTDLPRPYAHLRARDRELELSIGYPVSFQHISETDQLVLRHVSDAIAGDPLIGQALVGPPRVGAAVRG